MNFLKIKNRPIKNFLAQENKILIKISKLFLIESRKKFILKIIKILITLPDKLLLF